ncbi:MAG: TlpA family protein disulfide reductase [Candidatus Omnitrophica bacterium]|nr:TlpA family protein disulfide reductase [Candidatus Omnitrophota bacterium]MDE2222435.1 TlpA family protein disulfide reductase [Candidatus Omnitrophota bacterium]
MRLIFLFLFLFSMPSVWAMANLSQLAVRTPLVGHPAPDVVLPKTDGTSSAVLAGSKGRKTIVVFWATWCPHCHEDLSELNDDLDAIGQKGITPVLVDVGENKDQVRDYLAQQHIKLASFVDENSIVQDKYFLIGVPTLLFIDEKGIVRSVTHQLPSDYENYFYP